ncbi:MAG: hypothetical protein Kow0031_18170 [Anaerolineae bacterium]
METLRAAPGLFGPNTSLLTDITLIVQIVFYLMLSAGVVAQLQNRYKLHDALQIPVVILNLFFIGFVMVPTFFSLSGSLSTGIARPPVLVTAIHAMLGSVAQLLSIYCLLAGLKILPRKIGVLRYWMWGTYVAWTAAVVVGIGVYIIFYANPVAATSPAAPSQPGSEIISEHDEASPDVESVPTVSVATGTPPPNPTEPPAAASTPTPELIITPPADDTAAEHDGG